MPPRRALVTGASGGIGLELATLLARDEHDLVLVARSPDKLAAAAADLSARFGVAVQTIVQDLADPAGARSVFDAVGACDVLVNNAGFATSGHFAEIDLQTELGELQLNIVALTELTKRFLPGMLERKSGRILNVASTAAFQPGPLMAVYYASKAYVLSFSEAVAEELRGTGVTMTCLCPGATQTGFQDRAGLENARLFKIGVADAASVARAGYDAMMRGKPLVIPGLKNKAIAASVRFAPRALVTKLSRAAVEPHG